MGIFRSQKSYSAYATTHTKIIIISPKKTISISIELLEVMSPGMDGTEKVETSGFL